MKWQVNGKIYTNMNTASAAVERLRKQGKAASMSPVM